MTERPSNRSMSTAPTIFKYSSERGLAILENLELKITPPNAFNDPFEFVPRIKRTDPRERAIRYLRNKPEKVYQALESEGKFPGTFKDFQDLANSDAKFVEYVMSGLEEAGALTRNHLLDVVSLVIGVLCCSSRNDSILMWGHYCDCHKGLAIGFDSSNSIFQDMKPVQYVTDRVELDGGWLETDPEAKAFNEQIVYSKNEEWHYESEYRQVFELAALKHKPLDKGAVGYFLAIPSASIRSVIVGARSSPDFIAKVKAVLRHPQFSHVALNRADLHESKFALTFHRI